MFDVKDCAEAEYHFMRMMGRHRRNLSNAVLKAIGEKGSIEWEDHSYSSLCEAGELLHPTFAFLHKFVPNVSFEDYYQKVPAQVPLRSMWDGIGKTSHGSMVFLAMKGSLSADMMETRLDAERLYAVGYLRGKGIEAKLVDFILIDSLSGSDGYVTTKTAWLEAVRQDCYRYPCFIGVDGHQDEAGVG